MGHILLLQITGHRTPFVTALEPRPTLICGNCFHDSLISVVLGPMSIQGQLTRSSEVQQSLCHVVVIGFGAVVTKGCFCAFQKLSFPWC